MRRPGVPGAGARRDARQLPLPKQDFERIPRTGPLVVVANHPFGAIDGMVLAALLGSVRRDVKVMANYVLGRIPDLRDLFIFVDPFGGPDAAAHNSGPMRQSLRWLKRRRAGGVPRRRGRAPEPARAAGRGAGLERHDRPPRPPDRRGGAAGLLPAATTARCSNWPGCSTPGCARPCCRGRCCRRHSRVELRVGRVIPPRRLAAIEGDRELERLPPPTHPAAPPRRRTRRRTPSLPPQPQARRAPARFPAKSAAEPVIPPVDPALLAAEVERAARRRGAGRARRDGVLHARAPQIRNVLREIGRLREVTFRAAGEGTGKAMDLDTFDYDYVQMFLWNAAKGEVVGAYRLGMTDELLPAKGRLGLYTSTLFNYKAELLERISPGLEMGRSFVRAEYQKSYAPLLLLWKGIGHFVVRYPRYRYLFGPVSISNSYLTVSRQLMVRFLKMHHALPGVAGLVKGRNPFRPRLGCGAGDELCGWDAPPPAAPTGDELSELVAELEPDRKGIPVLLRQYLKLGAKIVDFNVDPAFADALDGLIVVDLTATDPRVLDKYMGREGCRSFSAHHAANR